MHHAHIDKFAYQDSPIHRLDARVKLLAAIFYTAAVLAAPRHSVSVLALFAVWPFAVLAIGGIPLRFAARHIVVVSSFVAVLALTAPYYLREPAAVAFGPWRWTTSEGWLRAGSIMGKFIVTMATLIGLVSTTRFSELLAGAEKMGVPKILVMQLGFLYRYIFVLIDRVHHMLRARAGRRLRNLGMRREMATAGAMVGSLLVRSIDTAEKVHLAMRGRGFDGQFRSLRQMRLSASDVAFAVAVIVYAAALHAFAVPAMG